MLSAHLLNEFDGELEQIAQEIQRTKCQHCECSSFHSGAMHTRVVRHMSLAAWKRILLVILIRKSYGVEHAQMHKTKGRTGAGNRSVRAVVLWRCKCVGQSAHEMLWLLESIFFTGKDLRFYVLFSLKTLLLHRNELAGEEQLFMSTLSLCRSVLFDFAFRYYLSGIPVASQTIFCRCVRTLYLVKRM